MRRTTFLVTFALGLSPLFMTSPGYPQNSASSVAQYEGIVDPFIDAEKATLAALTWGRPTMLLTGAAFAYLDAWRTASLSYLATIEADVKERMAAAITTNTVKDLRIGIESSIASTRYTLKKLKADLRWYEDNIDGRFANEGYEPTDADQHRYWERYQAIKNALKHYEITAIEPDPDRPGQTRKVFKGTLNNAEAEFDRRTRELTDGLHTVLERVTRSGYAMGSLRTDSGFLAQRMQEFGEAVVGIEQMALSLSDSGPRAQMRAIFTNPSENMIFFIQLASRDDSGNFTIRPDTRYPIVLYPDLSHFDKEIAKYQRGPCRAFIGVGPRDKLIVRAATMGIYRDSLRFQLIKGKFVRPDLNTLSRSFYYLGYESETPQGILITREYPIEEHYQWAFRNGWAPGETANDPQLKSSDGRELRAFGAPLQVSDDRMEWILPTSVQAGNRPYAAYAEVSGEAKFRMEGHRGGTHTRPEKGKGSIRMLLEAW